MDIDKILHDGIVFKKAKGESTPGAKPKQKKNKNGRPISGAAKMKADFEEKRAFRSAKKASRSQASKRK